MSVKNKWIIKSDNKILGPYSYEQVEDLIIKRQISLIDEIRDMEQRWSYVREVNEFKPLVEAVRKDLDNKSEATQTILTATQQTSTNTSELTRTPTDAVILNFTGVEVETTNQPAAPEVAKKATVNKTKKSESTVFVSQQEPVKDNSKVLFISLAFLVVALIGGWFYYTSYAQSKLEKTAFQQIRRLNLYGQDNKAVDLFKTLSVNSQDRILTDIIPLWLKLEASGAVSYNKLVDFSTSGKIIGNERKSQFQLVKFNKALQLSDVGNANESLVKAIDLDPSSLEVKENDATFMFSQKKYQDAAKIFKNLYDQTSKGRFLYGYTLSSWYAGMTNANQYFQLIENHQSNRADYTRELLLLQMLLTKKSMPENHQVFNTYYEKFITFPSQLSSFFRVSNLVFTEPYEWNSLNPVVNELLNYVDSNQKKSIEIYSHIEANAYEKAENILSKYAAQMPKEVVHNIQITLSYFKNDNESAQASAKNTQYLFLSSHLYLLLLKKENGADHSQMLDHVNYLLKSSSLFSNWSQLIIMKFPEEKDKMKVIIQGDKLYSNDFQPYLDIKALLSE